MKRWVRGGPPSLSADGKRFALVTGSTTTSDLHVIDIESGSDHVLASGGPWQVAGWGADAIYAMRVEYVQSAAYGTIGFGKGLWKLPIDGTKPVQLTSDSMIWNWVGGGGIFSSGGIDVAGGPNEIYRFDLQTTRVSTVFSRNVRSRVLAVDISGAALIMAEGSDEELWRVSPSNHMVELWSGRTDGIRPESPVAVDGSDIWLSSAMAFPESAWAIFHYSPRDGLKQVATYTDRPVQVAGACR